MDQVRKSSALCSPIPSEPPLPGESCTLRVFYLESPIVVPTNVDLGPGLRDGCRRWSSVMRRRGCKRGERVFISHSYKKFKLL